jgi:carbon-monoxide dehydrogenase medium subunit
MYDFDYYRPASLDAAARLLCEHSDYKVLAGGMSLIPSLKLRLARYAGIVDLGAIDALTGIRRTGDAVVIGAMTPHAAVAASAEVAASIPALAALAEGIGDPLVRNRGTLGGSIAHADPAADYPAALLCVVY